ncbi:cytochrome P450 [Robiginitalea sp. M366]|uniref:cytochrome P450 n=1 Tax=Robiginitalea aestuariiviva TaxID=3036903 RepID=UPI00240E6BF4|nr:cytochrome P450 [Robiginitalea aestuariiviva]MDG1571015.1 cytochrome P450 [Robiginitalea aestuariiviva]
MERVEARPVPGAPQGGQGPGAVPEADLTALHTVTTGTVLRNRKRILKNPLPFHRENFERHGHTFRVQIGLGSPVVFTRHPDLIRHILQKNHRGYSKSTLQTRDLAKYIGHGILTSEGKFWKRHRRLIQPAFHKEKLEGLLGLMFQTIRAELASLPEGREFDVFPHMSDLAFQVVARSLFSAGDLRRDMRRLQQITQDNQEMLIREMRQPYLVWWFRLTGRIRRHLSLSADARSLLDTIISKRVASGQEKHDLLDMLLAARYEDGTPMTRAQLIDEVMVLFTAGHETTANALSFALHLLACNPEVQDKAAAQARSLDWERTPPMALLQGLPLVRQCVEEAMRLYPPVYVIDRVSLREETLGGQRFPKGTTWLLSVVELHRLPQLWEEADAFRPERFASENPRRPSEHFYPFGAGPRMCIGNNFAMYEMVLALGWMLHQFQINTPVRSLEIQPLISLKPGQVPLSLIPRP